MDTTRRLYEPRDEAEARALETLLHEEGIEARLSPHRDTAYPGVLDRYRSWGELRVPADQFDRAGELLVAYLAAELPPYDQPEAVEAATSSAPAPRLAQLAFWLVLGVSLLANAVFLWQRYRPLPEVEEELGADGQLVMRTFYEDDLPVRRSRYDKQGRLLEVEIDDDGDGWVESRTRYDIERRPTCSLHDISGDGAFDEQLCPLLGGAKRIARTDPSRLLRWTRFEVGVPGDRAITIGRDEKPLDGLYEYLEHDSGARALDVDRDGFYEQLQCADGRSFDLLSCRLGKTPSPSR